MAIRQLLETAGRIFSTRRESSTSADGDDRVATSGAGRNRYGRTDSVGAARLEPDGGVVDDGAPSRSRTERSDGAGRLHERALLAELDAPAFVLDGDGEVVAWNDAVASMTGVDADRAVGESAAGDLFYPDRDDERTLAELVSAAPESAAEDHARVEHNDGSARYAQEEWLCDVEGTDRYFEHRASPLFEDGELVGVVQYSRERTTTMRRQEAVAHFVFELNQTVSSLNDGELASRVEFDGDREAVDDGLLAVEEHVNEMADQFETHVQRVQDATERLSEASRRAVAATEEVIENVDDQNTLLKRGVDEMQTFSATMEEVASTAQEVDAAASDAREAATNGVDAGTDAREATEAVIDIGENLVESVSSLEDRMDDIEEVTGVISDVAEQTNILALNANIEAARAGEEGDGFAVVAEEVKNLADETQQHTQEIASSIDRLRTQTDETVEAVTTSHEQIDDASDQIATALSAFEEIDEAVERVADGIGEVSRAVDDQATTVEDLTATLEDAREFADGTEAAADRISDATDQQAEAVDQLERRVEELRS